MSAPNSGSGRNDTNDNTAVQQFMNTTAVDLHLPRVANQVSRNFTYLQFVYSSNYHFVQPVVCCCSSTL
jgi:hypothetical protein